MFRSIRWRIAVPYSILALVTMTGITLWLSTSIRQAYLDTLRRQLADDAALIADDLRAVTRRSWHARLMLSDDARRYAAILGKRVTIIGADGTVLAESDADDAAMANHAGRPEVQQALAGAQGYSIRFSDTLREDSCMPLRR